jgi:colanic acid/amylovoran biosynthesis protein
MPSQARCILGNGYFTITGRMHAAVSTFQMNKPAICLSYSAKYKGVIGEGLKRNDLIIEATDDSLYRNGVLAKTVADKVNYIDNNYPSLIREIKSEVKKAQENAIIQIDLVKDTLMR